MMRYLKVIKMRDEAKGRFERRDTYIKKLLSLQRDISKPQIPDEPLRRLAGNSDPFSQKIYIKRIF